MIKFKIKINKIEVKPKSYELYFKEPVPENEQMLAIALDTE